MNKQFIIKKNKETLSLFFLCVLEYFTTLHSQFIILQGTLVSSFVQTTTH